MPSRSHDSLRLFVGLYPDRELAAAARARAEDLMPEGLEPAAADRLHVTALFLGSVPKKSLDRVRESVASAAAGAPPVEVRFDRLLALPQEGPARLVAATATETPRALVDLHERLVSRLTPGGRKRRPFLAHLTLGRFRPARRVRPELARGEVTVELPLLAVDRVVLVESRLRPQGSEHRRLEAFDLRGR